MNLLLSKPVGRELFYEAIKTRFSLTVIRANALLSRRCRWRACDTRTEPGTVLSSESAS